MIRYSSHFATLLVFAFTVLAVPDAALAQDPLERWAQQQRERRAAHAENLNRLHGEIPAPPEVNNGHGGVAFATPYEHFGFSGEARLGCSRDRIVFSVDAEERQMSLHFRVPGLAPSQIVDLVPTDGEWVVPVTFIGGLAAQADLSDPSADAAPLPIDLQLVLFSVRSGQSAGRGEYLEFSPQSPQYGRLHGAARLTKTPEGLIIATFAALAGGVRVRSGDQAVTPPGSPPGVPFSVTFRVRPDAECAPSGG